MNPQYYEYDFVYNDLLPTGLNSKYKIHHIGIHKAHDAINLTYYETHPLKDEFIGNCIYVNGELYNEAFNQVKLIQYLKPRVMYLTSQESGSEDILMGILGNASTLFIKNYCHASNSPYKTKNTLFIPLPYVKDMFHGRRTVYNSSTDYLNQNRSYVWSFFGNPKRSDRQKMIEVFSSWQPNLYNVTKPTKDVPEVYRNSWFVTVGRGQVVLDCFRMTEAMSQGAIPIIVGDNKEIHKTYDCFGSIPPCLFAPTWEQALMKAKQVFANNELLIHMGHDAYKWYTKKVLYTRNCIYRALGIRTKYKCHELSE